MRPSPCAMREVKAHLKKRPEDSRSDRLWLTEEGRPLTFWGAQSIFRRLKDRSGVTPVDAHLLRHNFAEKALANGAERGVLQDMMGDAATAMTSRYLGDERKAQAGRDMPRYSPHNPLVRKSPLVSRGTVSWSADGGGQKENQAFGLALEEVAGTDLNCRPRAYEAVGRLSKETRRIDPSLGLDGPASPGSPLVSVPWS